MSLSTLPKSSVSLAWETHEADLEPLPAMKADAQTILALQPSSDPNDPLLRPRLHRLLQHGLTTCTELVSMEERIAVRNNHLPLFHVHRRLHL